jgi:dethiobiotin synthetase
VPESIRPEIIFIAGSDTDVGKTYIASLLARQLRHSGKRVGVYKPVASGCALENGVLVSQDALQLWSAAGYPLDLDAVCPQRFVAPFAPNLAAKLEGREVDRDLLISGASRWHGHCDVLIAEGAGGLMSPIADAFLNIDLAIALAPVRLVIVVANRLGAIHQSLATCAAAEHRGLKPSGIVLSEVTRRESTSGGCLLDQNAAEIARYTDVPVLAQIAYGSDSVIAIDNRLPSSAKTKLE